MGVFNNKKFNSEVFGKYLETVPRVKQNAFLTAGILRPRADIKAMLPDQTGGNYVTVPMTGLIGGDPDNYDGSTNITSDGIDTYAQSMIVVGRAHSWTEKDFTFDITGKNFMEEIGNQVGNYWDDVDQDTILAILKGIFGVSDDGFNTKHTYDITNESVKTVGATTLNNAIQKAAGANKNLFKMAIMHSAVATGLENLQLLEYRKYTDASGIQRDLAIADWNGRTVLIDDDVPTEQIGTTAGVYTVTVGGTVAEGDEITVAGKKTTLDSTSGASATAAATAVVTTLGTMAEYSITRSGAVITFTEKTGKYGTGAPSASIVSTAGTVTVATTTEPVFETNYITYILGANALDYCDCGAKVPNEVDRKPMVNGGEDYLITRQRKLFAPRGFSFKMPTPAILSPANSDLENSINWEVVKSTTNKFFNSKAIPFVRIISRG